MTENRKYYCPCCGMMTCTFEEAQHNFICAGCRSLDDSKFKTQEETKNDNTK